MTKETVATDYGFSTFLATVSLDISPVYDHLNLRNLTNPILRILHR